MNKKATRKLLETLEIGNVYIRHNVPDKIILVGLCNSELFFLLF
jgi:hypothetical protein